MRTTLTLDNDVAEMLEREAHRQRRPFKQVVNDALRRGLSTPAKPRPDKPYRVKAHKSVLMPGIDPRGLNKLVDELDDEADREKLRRRS